MRYNIKAIPTVYNHVQFRSRLEARWAAFFDLCGWDWDYEPFDLEGWAPDFMLKGKTKALVEVKPIDFGGNDDAALRQAKVHAAKAFRTAATVSPQQKSMDDMDDAELAAFLDTPVVPPQYEILVIGNGPFESDAYEWSLGVFALERMHRREDIADLQSGYKTEIDYTARLGSFAHRISGAHDGDHHLRDIGDNTPKALWREAGNLVQWNLRRSAA